MIKNKKNGRFDYFKTAVKCRKKMAETSGIDVRVSRSLRRIASPSAALLEPVGYGMILSYQQAFLTPVNPMTIRILFYKKMAERVGFEPTDPCGSAVFKTAALNQLDHLSAF